MNNTKAALKNSVRFLEEQLYWSNFATNEAKMHLQECQEHIQEMEDADILVLKKSPVGIYMPKMMWSPLFEKRIEIELGEQQAGEIVNFLNAHSSIDPYAGDLAEFLHSALKSA